MTPAPGVHGQAYRGEQHLALGGEPGRGRFAVGERPGDDAGGGPGRVDRAAVRAEAHGRGVGGGQVVVEEAYHGGAPLLVRLVGPGQLGGVHPQQVVHCPATRPAGGDEVRAGQVGQRPADLARRAGGQADGGVEGDVRAGVQAQEPEQPGGRLAERAVRPGEDRPDIGVRGADVERVEARLGVAQLVGEAAQRAAGAGADAGRDHREGERQPGAAGHDDVGRARLGGDAGRPDPAGEEHAGLAAGHDVEAEPLGAILHGQAQQLVAAGHHDHAAG